MTIWMRMAQLCFLWGLLNSPVYSALADPGITEKSIRLGQSAAIDGPAKRLGTGMRDGLLAAF